MRRPWVHVLVAATAASLLLAACAPAAPAPAPTTAAAPAAPVPTKAAEPAKVSEPTKAPAAAAPTAAPTAAAKVTFPEKGKAITIIVPYAAGGGADAYARLVAASLEKDLGTPVRVENKSGGGTMEGATALAQSKPDGYTLGSWSLPSQVVPYLDASRKATYNRASFQPVALMTQEPILLAAKADGPYKNAKDMVDAAKAKPGTLKVGNSGMGTLPHLAMLSLEQMTGAKFAHVQFDSIANGMTAVLGGHIDAAAGTATGILPHTTSGNARVVGIMGPAENALFPGAKTFEGQGYKVMAITSSGMVASAGTPRAIVDILAASIKKALDTPDFEAALAKQGVTKVYMGPTEYEKFWLEQETWVTPLVKLAAEATK